MPAILRLSMAAIMLGPLSAALPILAAQPTAPPATECEDGYTVVEETCYREVVVSSRCKLVPETKSVKKAVYSYKDVPYCRPNCPNPLDRWGDAETCTACECCPRYKRVLVKREVVEKKETMKCVVEEVKEKVPYTVYRRVPCGATGVPGTPPGK